MNNPSEQLRSDLSLELALDETLSPKELREAVIRALGEDRCDYVSFNKTHKVVRYIKDDGNTELFLTAAVTFMGGQHNVFKHRAQLKTWYKEIVDAYKDDPCTNIRFLGVYHYQGNIVFIDFEKESYLKNKMHNSAAWVYTNDLYQAMRNGVFSRTDKNGNVLHAVKFTRLVDYINDRAVASNEHLFEQFRRFNRESNMFKGWLSIGDALTEMYGAGFSQWRQTEWFGWYLEYQFDRFTRENHIEDIMRYTGIENKGKTDFARGVFDFDIWFERDRFYGDLKSSDISKKVSPGNDQATFVECINMFDRFWYVIYEAECEKTERASEIRYAVINMAGEEVKVRDPNKTHRLLKEKVNFKKMTIIELNRINFRDVLSDFNQGRQQSGDARNIKFNINKDNIDNFVVFSETIEDIA